MSQQPTIPSETWITVQEAVGLLQLKPSTIIRRIQEGKLIGRKTRMEDPHYESVEHNGSSQDGAEHCEQTTNAQSESEGEYAVLLNALPYQLQQQYGEAQLSENQCLSLDLLSIRESKGNRSVEHYLKALRMFREAADIRRTHAQDGTITPRLKELARKHGISLRTLYRYEATPEIQAASPLFLDPVYLSAHMPKAMCLLAIDLAYALWLDPNHRLSQNTILRQVQALAPEMLCENCPYRAESDVRAKVLSSQPNTCPECRLKEKHMLAPTTRHPLNRLLAHVPQQQICYCREGVRAWRARFGHFAIREKPLQVNACFQGDHHVFDLFVDCSIPDQQGKKHHYLIRPVLTAWMDTASGCIVGWVISFLPDADTIAEAFSRAVAYTATEEFAGLPASVYVDCGKDYSAALLQDLDLRFRNAVSVPACLNDSFAGNALFPALNVVVYRARPYQPQSKSIERFFGTLERGYIAKLPGWCGNSIANRPPDFLRKLHRLQSEGKLFTLASFARYFASVILPDYHNTVPEGSTNRMTPLECYRSLPKARDLIPTWKTMSILKSRRAYYTVQRQGIRCQNVFYWSDALDPYVGYRLLVYYSESLPPLSVTVILNGRYLCEAYPVAALPFVGAQPDQLQAHLDAQTLQRKKMQAPVTRIQRIMRLSGLAQAMSAKDALHLETYGQVVDTEMDGQATDLLPEIPDDAGTPSGTYSSQYSTTTEEYQKLQRMLNSQE